MINSMGMFNNLKEEYVAGVFDERLSEEDVKLRFITPTIVDVAGWKSEQIKMELI